MNGALMKTAILMILALVILSGVAAGQPATPADSTMVTPTPAADRARSVAGPAAALHDGADLAGHRATGDLHIARA